MANSICHMPRFSLAAVPYSDNLRMDELTRSGVPAGVLVELAERMCLALPQIAKFVLIPQRTLDRRLANKANLKLDEGERALRMLRLHKLATEVFEDPREAAAWFNEPLTALGGARPIELCSTEAGAREVEQTLGRIEHGVFS